jgi:rubrerythrin
MVEDDEILEEEVVETDEPISEEEPEIELGENKEDAVDVQIQEGPVEDMEPEEPEQNFYANLAEEMDDTTLARLSSELISDFKKDKGPRS